VFWLALGSFLALGEVAPVIDRSDGYLLQENRALRGHVAQEDVEKGIWSFEQLVEAGSRLFVVQFTPSDGVGRPKATGSPIPTNRSATSGSGFLRSAGPDANSCVSCHNRPTVGGAGDFTANTFKANAEGRVSGLTINPRFSRERGTPALQGAGFVELVAREMTGELERLREKGIRRAKADGERVSVDLIAKGVGFGELRISADGVVDYGGVEGVDDDLIIKPFGQNGDTVSLREFTIDASNLHHGMQAEERYGFDATGNDDFDGDGVSIELTRGDVTALVAFQASLGVPGEVIPADPGDTAAARRGRVLFEASKCASCHISHLPLESSDFADLAGADTELTVDLLEHCRAPLPDFDSEGRRWVGVYSDFKRHIIYDEELPHYGNEVVAGSARSGDGFLTTRLWCVGNTAPYGHRGDITTIDGAIRKHGGEAASARREYERMSEAERTDVIAFLRSLQILPAGSARVVRAPRLEELPYATEECEEGKESVMPRSNRRPLFTPR